MPLAALCLWASWCSTSKIGEYFVNFLGWWIWVNWMLFEVSYLTWAQDGVALLNSILKKEDWSDLSGVIVLCSWPFFSGLCIFKCVHLYLVYDGCTLKSMVTIFCAKNTIKVCYVLKIRLMGSVFFFRLLALVELTKRRKVIMVLNCNPWKFP